MVEVISCEIALRWMPLDVTDGKSTLVQVMAWCRKATSHYLNQCWPRYLSPCGITKPQWVNSFWRSDAIWGHRSGSILAQVMAFAWWHQAIIWTSVGFSLVKFCGIQLTENSQRVPKLLFCLSRKIMISRLLPVGTHLIPKTFSGCPKR